MKMSPIEYLNPYVHEGMHYFNEIINGESLEENKPINWKVAIPAYTLNPLINVALTVFHTLYTLERVAKLIYSLVLALFSSIVAIANLGKRDDFNQFAIDQWKFGWINAVAIALSGLCVLANIGHGVQGFLSLRKAIAAEARLVDSQKRIESAVEQLHSTLFSANITE